jgi:hypothetical protein
MHQLVDAGTPAVVDGLFERIEDEVRAERRRDTPADDAPREDVDHERHVDEAAPRGHVGKVGDPELIRPRRGEPTIDEIGRAVARGVRLRGHDPRPSTGDARQPHLPHRALDGAPRDSVAVAA